ncbi:MAG: hypothetical protein JWQ74_2949 [Marmoricola sp.]|nr:hypothetical protein [Marmoricola sp.]
MTCETDVAIAYDSRVDIVLAPAKLARVSLG